MTTTQNAPATKCSRCSLSNCPGPEACLIVCLTCDDEQITWCRAEGCDEGYLIDEAGDLTNTKCRACKGKGEVRCTDC